MSENKARPATRVGREVIFEGGGVVHLGWISFWLYRLGIKKTIGKPYKW